MLKTAMKLEINELEEKDFIASAVEKTKPDNLILQFSSSLEYSRIAKIFKGIRAEVRGLGTSLYLMRDGDWDYSLGRCEESATNLNLLEQFLSLDEIFKPRGFIIPFEAEPSKYMFNSILDLTVGLVAGISIKGDFSTYENWNYFYRKAKNGLLFTTDSSIYGSDLIDEERIAKKTIMHFLPEPEGLSNEQRDYIQLLNRYDSTIYIEGSNNIDSYLENRKKFEGAL